MFIRRVLLLCLVAVTLGLTGPLTRGLSSHAAALPQTGNVAASFVATNVTNQALSKRCQRGAVVWSNCYFDLGYAPLVSQRTPSEAVSAIEVSHEHLTDNFPLGGIFRPPRSS